MTTANETQTRRRFVATLPGLLVGVVGMTRWTDAATPHACGSAAAAHAGNVRGAARRGPAHPEPRPGITGAKVLTKSQLTHNRDAAPIFDMVRQIPQIADGIRCHCGCGDADPKLRSLLSCYEGDGMAQHCEICQGQGKLAFTLFKQGKSLAEIRAALDKEFG